MMSPHLQNRNAPSKQCSVSGCSGRMISTGDQEAANAAESAGRSSDMTWVCDNNPAHVEVVTPGDERGIAGG